MKPLPDNTSTLLCISGSTRAESTNTLLLRSFNYVLPANVEVMHCSAIAQLPIFNQDLEGDKTPEAVTRFCAEVENAAGIIISSPEYVHAIPGGLKNAIDWLVSRNEIINKPIVLAHASHRGDEVLTSLRRVLSTVSTQFNESIFLQIPLMSKNPEEAKYILSSTENRQNIHNFLCNFIEIVKTTSTV